MGGLCEENLAEGIPGLAKRLKNACAKLPKQICLRCTRCENLCEETTTEKRGTTGGKARKVSSVKEEEKGGQANEARVRKNRCFFEEQLPTVPRSKAVQSFRLDASGTTPSPRQGCMGCPMSDIRFDTFEVST